MSGKSVFSFSKKIKPSLMEERLDVESDRRLFGCMGSGSVIGAVLVTYALTVPIIIPSVLYWHCPTAPTSRDLVFHGILPENIHDKLHAPKPRIVKNHPLQTGHQAPRPTSRHPAEVSGTLAQKLINSRSDRANFSAYELIDKTLKNLDQNKLENVAVLTRSGETRLSGRRGKYSETSPDGYYPDGNGRDGTDGFKLPGFTGERLPPTARPEPRMASSVSIDMRASETVRSSAAILAVIRAHAPGLRHLYNTYLRVQPGMKGKVTLRFAIAPSGQVVDVGLESSTTDAPAFDKEVADKVMAWRFEPVKAVGNDLVTVPFNFSE